MIDFFTKQEKIFIGFLIAGILVGAGIELYRSHFTVGPNSGPAEEKAAFEKLFHAKAILIDSLLADSQLPVNIENYSESSTGLAISPTGGTSNQAGLQIEINHASRDELIKLPQIGRVIANRIVEYRSIHGAFKDIEDIMNVKGIGEKKFKAIKPYIYIKEN